MRDSKGAHWLPTKSFEDDGVDKWQVRAVLVRGHPAVSDHRIEFRLRHSLHLRVLCHSQEEDFDEADGLLM
jgi:hypothetical protein